MLLLFINQLQKNIQNRLFLLPMMKLKFSILDIISEVK